MKALQGLKILDFSTLLPGPYATMLLANMGAKVLSVESPTRPDLVKGLAPQIDGQSAAYRQLNQRKSHLALDLKEAKSVAKVHQLIQEYDIVVEQFRPGVMSRLGVGYEQLKAINPNLIYCSITGYGQSGPYRDRAGHDLNYLALSGLAHYSRRKGHAPVPQGMQIADIAGGSHHAVMAILAAVIHRQATGEGQYIDISMTDAAFALNAMAGATALAGGEPPEAETGWLNGGTFYDYYETADERYMAVGSLEPQFQKSLLACLNLEHLAELCADFRPKAQAKVKKAIAEAFLRHPFAHWCEVFSEVDACVEPVLTFEEACRHDHLLARGVTQMQGDLKQLSHPFRLK